eukprot:COSAG06_NODE_392_length_16344_cov_4.086981_3_plen_152_part_00
MHEVTTGPDEPCLHTVLVGEAIRAALCCTSSDLPRSFAVTFLRHAVGLGAGVWDGRPGRKRVCTKTQFFSFPYGRSGVCLGNSLGKLEKTCVFAPEPPSRLLLKAKSQAVDIGSVPPSGPALPSLLKLGAQLYLIKYVLVRTTSNLINACQ